jgi:hypothetical protein
VFQIDFCTLICILSFYVISGVYLFLGEGGGEEEVACAHMGYRS